MLLLLPLIDTDFLNCCQRNDFNVACGLDISMGQRTFVSIAAALCLHVYECIGGYWVVEVSEIR